MGKNPFQATAYPVYARGAGSRKLERFARGHDGLPAGRNDVLAGAHFRICAGAILSCGCFRGDEVLRW